MEKIEDFDSYKADFLAANKQPREHVLLRRVKDNQLTWAPAEAVGHYDGHEIEPFGDEEPKPAKAAKSAPPAKKTGGIPKAGAINKKVEAPAGEGEPGCEV